MTMLQRGKIKTCPQCAAQVKDLQFHLSDVHKINVEGKLLHFRDVEEFKIWKENIEKETVSRYVKHSGGKKRKNGGILTYYYCHRDGSYIPKGKNERSLKMMGSNKINGNCPSLIKVEENSEGLKVLFMATHVGHTCDISRMVLSAPSKVKIGATNKLKRPLDVELRKNYMMEHIIKVVGDIKTEAGISALEKGFMAVEAAVKNAENPGETAGGCLDQSETGMKPPKKDNHRRNVMVISTKKNSKILKHFQISSDTQTNVLAVKVTSGSTLESGNRMR